MENKVIETALKNAHDLLDAIEQQQEQMDTLRMRVKELEQETLEQAATIERMQGDRAKALVGVDEDTEGWRVLARNRNLVAQNNDLCQRNERLQKELGCAELRLKEQERKYQEQGVFDENTWQPIDSEDRPMDGEIVLVDSEQHRPFVQTYDGRFTDNVVAWMRIPERVVHNQVFMDNQGA